MSTRLVSSTEADTRNTQIHVAEVDHLHRNWSLI